MNKNYILKKLFSGTVLRIVVLCASIIIAFFMMPFLIHSLGDTQYGLWVLVGTLTGYYGFLDFGLASATQRYISQALGNNAYEKMNIVVNSSLFVYTFLGIGILAVSFIVSVVVFYTASQEHATTLAITSLILGTTFSVQFPARTFGGILRSYIRQDIVIGVELFGLIFRTALIVFFIIRGYGIITLAAISFITIMLSSFVEIIASYKVFKQLTLSKRFIKKDSIKSLFSYSWIAFIANITEILKFKLSPLIVASVISVEAVVIYAVAFRFLEYFSQLFRNLTQMITPVFSQIESRNNSKKLKLSFVYSMMSSIVAALFVGSNIIFFGYDFIILWMGEKYIPSYHVLWITGVAVTLWISQYPAKELLFGTSNHKYYAFLSTLGLCLTATLSVALGIKYGLYGIAAGMSIGILIPELIFPFIIKHVFDFGFRDVYIKTLLPVALKTILFLGIIFGTMLLIDVKLNSYFNIILWSTFSIVTFTLLNLMFLPYFIKSKVYDFLLPKLYFYRRSTNV